MPRKKDQREKIPLVLTAREAAQYLRFSEATIIRFAKQGILLGVKVGRVWRFPKETVFSLLEADTASIKKRATS